MKDQVRLQAQQHRQTGSQNQGDYHPAGGLPDGFKVHGLLEESPVDNGHEVSGIEQAADQENDQGRPIASFQSTQTEVPFADKSTDRRKPCKSQRSHGKGSHGPGHGSTDAIQFADPLLVGIHVNGARAEKQHNLHGGVVGNVQQPANQTARREQPDPQDHVRKVADGGVGQAPLQMILCKGQAGGQQNGAAGEPEQDLVQSKSSEHLGPKDEPHHPNHPENARFYDSHRVEQGTDRRGSHHGRRQPGVQGHDGRLHAHSQQEHPEKNLDRGR